MPARQRWCALVRVTSTPSSTDLAGIGREIAGDQIEQASTCRRRSAR